MNKVDKIKTGIEIAETIKDVTKIVMRREIAIMNFQKKVDDSQPSSPDTDLCIADDGIIIEVMEEGDVDYNSYQEYPMNEEEKEAWKSCLSTAVGETTKAALEFSAFEGLLRCNAPIKDLCPVKDNPKLLRGIIMKNGKISKQATFSEVKLGRAAPLLGFQFMAAVTSQYYQQIITERLDEMSNKIDNILSHLEGENKAKLATVYNNLGRIGSKDSFNENDRSVVSDGLNVLSDIRNLYKGKVEDTRKELRIEDPQLLKKASRWTNASLAKEKIKKLDDSRFFENLKIAVQADILYFIASALSVRIAEFLGDTEDAKSYADRMTLDFWNEYVEIFYSVKHEVIKYLALLEEDATLICKKTVANLKDEQKKKFCNYEDGMQSIKKQLECELVQYVKIEKGGEMKKYVMMS